MATERMSATIESPKRNEVFGAEKADFDCDFYTMAISDSPDGFVLETRDSLPRRDDYTKPLPKELLPNRRPVFDDNGNQVFKKDRHGNPTRIPLMIEVSPNPNRDALRIGMQAQMRGFTRATETRDRLHEYREVAPEKGKEPSPEAKEKFEAFKQAQEFSNGRNTHTAGIREIRRDPEDRNKISFLLRPVSFHMANNFSFENFSDELLQMSANSSTTVAIITADNKLVVQHRSTRNIGWGDVPAASASGYLDEVDFESRDGRRVLKPIDTQIAIDNAVREIEEEIGIGRDKLTSIKLTALVHERENVHDELLYLAKSSLTSEQMMAESQKTLKNNSLPPEEFAEKYDFIDATPEAIERLLTQVLCPLPYSHSAVFVAAGYALVLERDGREAAITWKERVEKGVKDNYERINSIVREFYERHPEKLNEIPKYHMDGVEKGLADFKKQNPSATKSEINAEIQKLINAIPKRNPNGFSKFYLPTDQGLQSYSAAMRGASVLN